jgi:hypothetical protein
MEDGKIIREDRIGSPLEEDLKIWSHSELGKRIQAKDEPALFALGIDKEQMETLLYIFEQSRAEEANGSLS